MVNSSGNRLLIRCHESPLNDNQRQRMNTFFRPGNLASATFAGLLAFLIAAPESAQADIVERKVTSASGQSASGFVFQSSKNRNRTKKSRVTTSSVVVPSLSSIFNYNVEETVVTPQPPQAANVQTSAPTRPRFGYGSDYGTGDPVVPSQPIPPVSVRPQAESRIVTATPRFLPVVSTREYYPVLYQTNPYYYGYGHHFHSYHAPCYSPFSWGIPQIRVSYRGGKTSTSAWGSFFGSRIFR